MNKNKMIENRLKDSVVSITPKYEESLYEKNVSAAKGDEWYLEGTETSGKKRRSILTPALAMVFSVVLMIAGFHYYSAYFRTYATVYMDINPSLTIEVSRNEKVKSVIAENEDAAVILEGLQLKDVHIDTAVDAILGSMVRHGYIDEVHNILLLSLECEDTEYASVLQEKLSRGMNEYLQAYVRNSCVLKQEITADGESEDLAEKYGITPGKVRLIQKAMEDNPDLNIDELAEMPVNELVVYLYRSGFNLRPYSDEVEDLLEAHGFDDDPYEQYYEDEEQDDHMEADDDHDDEDPDDEDHGDDDIDDDDIDDDD